jgi:predicted HicB family RNase H-like nuclease
MSQLAVTLPNTLFHQLAKVAKLEEVSLNQYITYILTRHLTEGYLVQALSEEAIAQQQPSFNALLQELGQASDEEVQAFLAQRGEPETPEPELTAEIRMRFQKLLEAKQSAE